MTQQNLSIEVPVSDDLPTPEPLIEAGPLIRTPILVTQAIPITRSDDGQQKVFLNWETNLGSFNNRNFQLFLSGEPSSASPIIVDDGLFINGRHHSRGFSGTMSDPRNHIGKDPRVAYHPVESINITSDLRSDGKLFIQLMDLGGSVFCCSRIYLIALRR